MFSKYAGDTIVFEASLTDEQGTAITGASVSLSVTDGVGSTVMDALTVSHVSDGTYQRSQNVVGWGNGPIKEYWRFANSLGTTTRVVTNGFRIVGTESPQPYIFKDELPAYFENIEDYFDGNEDALIVDAFNEINPKLESLGYKMPIRPKADGFFDQPLRDWNAYLAIVRIVGRRQSGFNRDDDKPWFSYFGEKAGSICKRFEDKEYNLEREYSVAEAGIGQATKTVGTSIGQMETNWRGGVGTGFQDFTFERDWIVEVTGTGQNGTINECPFKWSNDGGFSYETAFVTNFDWQHLRDNVFVRFHRGTSTNSNNLFAVGDKWTFKTFPRNQAVGGKRAARSY